MPDVLPCTVWYSSPFTVDSPATSMVKNGALRPLLLSPCNTDSRDFVPCVFADLSNRLSHAVGPACTVTTASDTHIQMTSRTSAGVASADAAVHRFPNLHFLHAVSKPYVHQQIVISSAGAAFPTQAPALHGMVPRHLGSCGSCPVALLWACLPCNRPTILTQLNTLTYQLHSWPACLVQSTLNLRNTT